MKAIPLIASLALFSSHSFAQATNLEFDDGVSGWRTVLDGVMGGVSTGRVTQSQTGVLNFSGTLSLDNNGGFSQIRTGIPEGRFEDTDGVVVRVKGDGRTYQFNVRVSNVRMMAGGYELEFDTKDGEWTTHELRYEDFALTSFGREVQGAPAINPSLIESVGVTLGDGIEGPFSLDIDYIRPLGSGSDAAPRAGSLGDVAGAAGLTTLLQLVDVAGIELPADQRVTILAPTNAAFDRLSKDQVEFLTSDEGRATLQKVLAHHVAIGAADSSTVLSRRSITTLSGQRVMIDADSLTVGGASLVAADVEFDQGLVHVIDRVIIPETRSAAEIVASTPELSTLLAAVQAAGLTEQLGPENSGPMTIFAPTNAAFEALGSDAINSLLANRRDLTRVLGTHVLPIALYRDEMLSQGSARTLLGGDVVEFAITDGALTVDGVKFVSWDIPAANGVIHVIDSVILPESAPSTEPRVDNRDAVLRVMESAIERGAPLFNDGNPDACAVTYATAIESILLFAPEDLGADNRRVLRSALADAEQEHNARDKSWTLRRAMDRVYADLATPGAE